jgi:hypothetical protein
VVDLVEGEVGTDRKAQELGGEPLGDREVSLPPSHIRERRLQVDGRRIADDGVDAGSSDVAEQIVAAIGSDLKEMVDVLLAALDTLKRERQVGQTLAVRGGDLAAPDVPLGDHRQLVVQDGGLDRVELAVEPDDDVMVLAVLPELPSCRTVRSTPSSLVVIAPPSPAAARFLLGWKLKHAAAPRLPTGRPSMCAPTACAASSTIAIRPSRAWARIAFIGAGSP